MEKKKKIDIRYGVVAFLVIGIMFSYTVLPRPVLEQDENKSWHIIWEGTLAEAAEADPGSGNSGILEVFIINHTATPDTAYAENTSATLEGWCTANNLGYASADDSNIDIAHSTSFDIVVRVRGNQTHCYRTDKFFHTDLRVRITSSDLSIGADTEATCVVTHNDSSDDFIHCNFYEDNSGSGFTISKDSTNEIDNIKFEAYY